MVDHPHIAIHTILVLNLLNAAYLGIADPHDDLRDKGLEFTNELGFHMICYGAIVSMHSRSLTFDFALGWIMIDTLYHLLVVNFLVVGRGHSKKVWMFLKKKWYKMKNEKLSSVKLANDLPKKRPSVKK